MNTQIHINFNNPQVRIDCGNKITKVIIYTKETVLKGHLHAKRYCVLHYIFCTDETGTISE